MVNKMYTRGLTSSVMTGDGTNHQLVNLANLVSFESETVTNVNSLIDHINHLHRKLNDVSESLEFAAWIQTIHPHLIEEYKISERVAARLTDDTPAEQCEAKA